MPVLSWCRGEFRAGRPAAYAVAVGSANGSGRYLVLESDAAAVGLASFTDGADLSCYTTEEAKQLDRSIASTDIIHGTIAPTFPTTVVCAFVESTRAVCWQYSPAKRTFVQVGGWIT